MEFDFTILARKERTHVLADHMSRIPNGEKPIGVEDDLPDAPPVLLRFDSRGGGRNVII